MRRPTATSITLLLTALLGGCVNLYKPPQGERTAELTLWVSRNIHPGSYVLAQAFANERCDAHPAGTRLAFFPDSKSATPNRKTIRIDTDRDFVLTYHFTLPANRSMHCETTAAFRPQPAGRYVARFMVEERGCRIVVEPQSATGLDAAGWAAQIKLHQVEPVCFDGYTG